MALKSVIPVPGYVMPVASAGTFVPLHIPTSMELKITSKGQMFAKLTNKFHLIFLMRLNQNQIGF